MNEDYEGYIDDMADIAVAIAGAFVIAILGAVFIWWFPW